MTSASRDSGKPSKDSSAQDVKELAEHMSGEKLKEKITQIQKVKKTMGDELIDSAQLADALLLKKSVAAQQKRKLGALMSLMRPLYLNIVVTLVLSALSGVLQGVFHHIGTWARIMEDARQGNLQKAMDGLVWIGCGHLVEKAVRFLGDTVSENAQSRLGQSVRNGVLNQMVRQDFEYFYRNSAGVLQDRLNRDANELGSNLIVFPRNNIRRVTYILSNLAVLFTDVPLKILIPGMLPTFVMTSMHV